jgi:hypothetical protein
MCLISSFDLSFHKIESSLGDRLLVDDNAVPAVDEMGRRKAAGANTSPLKETREI